VTEKATFGGGCFWGVEIAFRNVPGVLDTAVGYEGGTVANPSYEDVCTDGTGHAEVVQVEFDPDELSYEELLDTFWEVHDPTQKNRQGPDVGSQYRSVILFHSPEQEEQALEAKARVQAASERPVVTEIVPAAEFWRAEDYHQQYLVKRGLATCRI
jgi:peptide-methionine (S)-S-oxide reductase